MDIETKSNHSSSSHIDPGSDPVDCVSKQIDQPNFALPKKRIYLTALIINLVVVVIISVLVVAFKRDLAIWIMIAGLIFVILNTLLSAYIVTKFTQKGLAYAAEKRAHEASEASAHRPLTVKDNNFCTNDSAHHVDVVTSTANTDLHTKEAQQPKKD